MRAYDLYGSKQSNLDFARSIVEKALGVRFTAHESDWRGGEYFRYRREGDESFMLQLNVGDDDEPAELVFPEYLVLLYIERTTRSDEIRSLLAERAGDFILLKHDEL